MHNSYFDRPIEKRRLEKKSGKWGECAAAGQRCLTMHHLLLAWAEWKRAEVENEECVLVVASDAWPGAGAACLLVCLRHAHQTTHLFQFPKGITPKKTNLINQTNQHLNHWLDAACAGLQCILLRAEVSGGFLYLWQAFIRVNSLETSLQNLLP